MPDTEMISPEELLRMTTEVAAAYFSNNSLPSLQLPEVIKTIHESLTALRGGEAAAPAEPPTPAVPIKKSVTPDDYRRRWGLGADYPMVAPTYAAKRSALAKKIGLGRTDASESRPAAASRRPARVAGAAPKRRSKKK